MTNRGPENWWEQPEEPQPWWEGWNGDVSERERLLRSYLPDPVATPEQSLLAPIPLAEIEQPELLGEVQGQLERGEIKGFQIFDPGVQDLPKWADQNRRAVDDGRDIHIIATPFYLVRVEV